MWIAHWPQTTADYFKGASAFLEGEMTLRPGLKTGD